MNQYMIDVSLPDFLDESFMALIPRQRAYVDELMNKGIITSYSLSMERNKLWITMTLETEKKVIKTLKTFPIYNYITFEIIELAFHNSATVFYPTMSLN